MYVYIHIHIHEYIHIDIYIHTHKHVYIIYIYIRIYTHTFIHMHILHVYKYDFDTCMCVKHVCVCVCLCIHVCMHTRARAHMHLCIYVSAYQSIRASVQLGVSPCARAGACVAFVLRQFSNGLSPLGLSVGLGRGMLRAGQQSKQQRVLGHRKVGAGGRVHMPEDTLRSVNGPSGNASKWERA